MNAIVTQARAVQVDACDCGRFPTLKRMGGRSLLVHYVCRPCNRKGVAGVDSEGAARKWNQERRR